MEGSPCEEAPGARRSRPPKVCIVTVDPSGDAAGGALARALTAHGPIELWGAGGPAMREAGVQLLADTLGWSSLGVVGVVRAFPRAWIGSFRLRHQVADLAPDLLVVIDCGTFNVRLAGAVRRLRKQQQPVLYYIPPRSWSRRWRVGRLAKIADYIAAPFPWNVEGDDGTGRVRFVGHPAADILAALPDQAEARRQMGLAPDQLTLGLLPGSRELELRVHLPILLGAARRLRTEFPGLQLVLSRARGASGARMERAAQRAGLEDVRIVDGAALPMRASDVALVCLGTATLEGAVVGCPMVTFYRGTWLQGIEYLIKPPRTSYYAMPSIIAGERILTEVAQWEVTPERLAAEAGQLLRDPAARRELAARLARVAQQLGGQGASDRAAQAVWDALEGRWHGGSAAATRAEGSAEAVRVSP